jgi:histidine triad (HIT) family protein
MTTGDCVFCRIARGELPASVVHEDEHTIAIMDAGQVNPGHVLVLTKAHVPDVFGLDDALAAAVFTTTTRVARAVRRAMAPAGMTLLQANGAAGFQTVMHFHIHVLPREDGDGVELAWPAKRPPKTTLDELAARLRAAMDE